MDRIETVSLIGLGAVGSSYLAKISESVPSDRLRVVASGERAARYRENGVTVNGKKYFFPVFEPDCDITPADLMIFAVKNNHLERAMTEAKKHIGPETVILSLLNGITSERLIADAYGNGGVLLSTVMGIDGVRTGDSTVYSGLGAIQFGDAVKGAAGSPNVRLVGEFFGRTGVPYEIHEDMPRILWRKFMLNVGANQTSAILRAPYGILRDVESVRALMVGAMEEVLAVAEKENINLTKRDLRDLFEPIGKLSPSAKTSMLQDVEARRPTENASLGGVVVELGRRHGVPVPVNDMLSRIIKAIEDSY
jgi:2-dehydropantoate 2-reductase